MFDHVLIEGHELPGIDPERLQRVRGMKDGDQEDLAGKPVVFQTKDLENYLGTYVIKDGRLYERIYEHEDVPEEERPYYGKPEWEYGDQEGLRKAEERTGRSPSWLFSPEYYREVGSVRVSGWEGLDLEYHGDLIFYATKKDLGLAEEHGAGLATFRARFTDGDLQWITPYDGEEVGTKTREWRTRRRRRR